MITDFKSQEDSIDSINEIEVKVDATKFAMLYTLFLNGLQDNPLGEADKELFAYLVMNYGVDTPFSITGYIKGELASLHSKSLTTYHNSTRQLLKFGFIYTPNKSRTYLVNRDYSFNGSSSNGKKVLITLQTV